MQKIRISVVMFVWDISYHMYFTKLASSVWILFPKWEAGLSRP